MSRPGARMAVVTTAHPWGDPRVFERELAACLEWGMEVHAFVALPGPPPPAAWSAHPAFTLHPLPRPRRRLGRFRLALGVWREVLRQGPWALVHFHDPELMPAMALLGLLSPDTYLLCDLHEDLPLQILSKDYLPPWVRMPALRLTRLMHRMARQLFSGFAPATEAIARAWPPDQTRVVHNYPKALFAAGAPQAALPDPHRVVYVGGLSEARGILVALGAMRMARLRMPGLRLELLGWVMEPAVGRAVAEAVAEGWCLHQSWLDPEALAARAAGAGIGLVTLLPKPNYLEALPTKLFEYMAMGIPVLASDFPLWRELVTGAGAGQVTSPAEGAVAEALIRMASDPEELARCGARGRAAYRERYRWEAEARNLAWHLRQAGLLAPFAPHP